MSDTYDKSKEGELVIPALKKYLKLLEAQKETVSEIYYKNVSKWAKEKLSYWEGEKNSCQFFGCRVAKHPAI